jgi:uncharacterized lipoprotein
MDTRITLQRTGLLIAALYLGACALSPQVVQIQPQLEPVQSAAGMPPASVALEVADTRAEPVVGYRGGVYATAGISTAADMANTVRSALAGALSARGLRVVEPGQAGDIRLRVEIAELSYAARQENVKRVIETSATVRATSVGSTLTRTGEYRDRRTKEVLKPPSEAENAALVNAVLSAALQRLVADPDLLKH